MSSYRPSSAPACWGLKFQDGEKECKQCSYNDSCRPAMMNRMTQSLPVIQNFAPPAAPAFRPPAQPVQVIPLPARPLFAPPTVGTGMAPPPPPPPKPVTQAPPAPPQAGTYYQNTTGYSLPNQKEPNPFAAWFRPGAQAPAYHFIQYPGERTSTRLVKNAILRALEAIFAELMQFFRHWTWPPAVAR